MPGRGESEWLADPNDYVVHDLPDHADGADRAQRRRDGGLDRHVDGRAPRHGGRGAAEEPDRAGSSSTTSGPPSSRPRSIGSAVTSASIRASRPTPRSNSTYARFPPRSGPSPTRNGSTSRGATSGSAPTAAGDWPTIRASPCRSARSAAPPDLWGVWDAIRCPTLVLRGAQSDLLSAATADADGQARAAADDRRIRRMSAMRRCCCPPSRSIPSRDFLRDAATPPSPPSRTPEPDDGRVARAAARARLAGIAYNRRRSWP